MRFLVSLLLFVSVCVACPAVEFAVFSTAGPCPKCGVLLHDVKPVKVQDGSTHSDASGTTTTQLLWFKCPQHGKFAISGPAKHLPPPTLIEKVTSRPLEGSITNSLTAGAIADLIPLKPQKLTTPLPPMPVVWQK